MTVPTCLNNTSPYSLPPSSVSTPGHFPTLFRLFYPAAACAVTPPRSCPAGRGNGRCGTLAATSRSVNWLFVRRLETEVQSAASGLGRWAPGNWRPARMTSVRPCGVRKVRTATAPTAVSGDSMRRERGRWLRGGRCADGGMATRSDGAGGSCGIFFCASCQMRHAMSHRRPVTQVELQFAAARFCTPLGANSRPP
jgi:hypothetical protein